MDLGQLNQAAECYQQLLAVNPNDIQANNNLGTIYFQQTQYTQAKKYFIQARTTNPKFAYTHFNLGNIYHFEGDLEKSKQAFKKALEVQPQFPEALTCLGKVYEQEEDWPTARKAYLDAYNLNPNLGPLISNLIYFSRLTCDWELLKKIQPAFQSFVNQSIQHNHISAELPFLSLISSDNPATNQTIAQGRSQLLTKQAQSIKPSSFTFSKKKSQKIHIGYITNDLLDHPVTHISKSMFGLHDRRQFQVSFYSYRSHNKDNAYLKQVKAGVNNFINISALSDKDAAKKIHHDQVDILIDLKGYTGSNRLLINALKPAPIQATFLGFPGTLGADFIDYNIVDQIVVPQSFQKYYTEKLVYMPDCYQVNDSSQPIAARNYSRSTFNLPEDAFVFCSFNLSSKIQPELFSTWMTLLKSIDRSVLWLLNSNPLAKDNLKRAAKQAGVHSDRLIFSDRIQLDEHLARLKLADLGLDTFIHNGGATSSNLLWTGVPLITVQGQTYLSRMSSSLLTTMNLPELITLNLKQYRELALNLATNPKKLAGIRQKVVRNRTSSPLFNTQKFVHHLEYAYTQMWRLHSSGKSPQHIHL